MLDGVGSIIVIRRSRWLRATHFIANVTIICIWLCRYKEVKKEVRKYSRSDCIVISAMISNTLLYYTIYFQQSSKSPIEVLELLYRLARHYIYGGIGCTTITV